MIDGEMQAFALTLDKFLEHAAKWCPEAQVVTAPGRGRIDRIGYADLLVRCRRVSAMLAGLGVGGGRPRGQPWPGTPRPTSRPGTASWAWARYAIR